jgi:hypothetical protein
VCVSHRKAAVGDLPCEPLGRKPRAIAISPAPNRLCYTAGITNLLVPKRSVVVGLFKCPTACAGWLTVGDLSCEPLGRKPRAIAISPAPNRLCYTAGILYLLEPKRSVVVGLFKSPNRLRWLAHCR